MLQQSESKIDLKDNMSKSITISPSKEQIWSHQCMIQFVFKFINSKNEPNLDILYVLKKWLVINKQMCWREFRKITSQTILLWSDFKYRWRHNISKLANHNLFLLSYINEKNRHFFFNSTIAKCNMRMKWSKVIISSYY